MLVVNAAARMDDRRASRDGRVNVLGTSKRKCWHFQTEVLGISPRLLRGWRDLGLDAVVAME
ncbi:hypothetical protein VW29_06255 [Devosia limi DSM 17137]|uniref:Uncharacterized protein n=1 Tax=Devosia limi DSM 17137 TaxID=1121477 RepID=A0A0F5LVJ8_9HYPH|nr:hypothetical protein VW29_06255 [Devosia limi DSM 17137]